MAELEARDRLEPPGVSPGRVALALACVFILLALALGAVAVFATLRIGDRWRARARPFPAPALETNLAPRVTADRGHGPKPYRELPASERAARTGEPDPALAAAMRAVAARGAAAYDPWPSGAKP